MKLQIGTAIITNNNNDNMLNEKYEVVTTYKSTYV
jgi:hypothetical protein